MVGARAPSAAGERFARTPRARAGRGGVSVISGLALGIDAAAHAGALDGGGRTVAVLGCGIDRDYPRRNARARRAHRRGRRDRLGVGAGRRARALALSRPQPHRRGARPGHGGRRGDAPLGRADHRRPRARDRPRRPGRPGRARGSSWAAARWRCCAPGAAPVGGAGDVLDALGVQIEPSRPGANHRPGVGGVLWAELRRRPRRRDALALATGLAPTWRAPPCRARARRPGGRGARRHPLGARAGPRASGKLVGPRGVAQLVERRSPKPKVAGSSPVAPVAHHQAESLQMTAERVGEPTRP